MKETIYCDPRQLKEGIETLANNEEYDRLNVLDTDCVLRGITREKMEERNIRDYDIIVTIEKKIASTFKFQFHQSMMGAGYEFTLRPPAPNEIDADYCTTPGELGGSVGGVARKLEDIYPDISWDISTINAASIASTGHLCDFEFEYEFIVYP